MTLQSYFSDLLKEHITSADVPKPKLTKEIAQKLIERIDQIQLYCHSYAFVLNFQYGNFDAIDFLDFAYEQNLSGMDLYIGAGKSSLRKKSDEELKAIKDHAKKLKLGISLDVSSTSKEQVDEIARIAKLLEVKRLRVYILYQGHVSEIIKKGIQDLKYAAQVAEENDLYFVLEPHEVLRSKEFAQIMKEVNSPRIGLLFDFGNMINADENPMDALRTMAPYIHQVHLKGVKKIRTGEGYEQVGVPEGEGDLPQMMLLFKLLLLGDSEPQVTLYALEQEAGYLSPASRFGDESKDPLIPSREPSNTAMDKSKSVEENLLLEKKNACKQILYVKDLLEQMKTLSEVIIRE